MFSQQYEEQTQTQTILFTFLTLVTMSRTCVVSPAAFNSYVTVSTAEGAPQRDDGFMAVSTDAGPGIAPKTDVLGDVALEVN